MLKHRQDCPVHLAIAQSLLKDGKRTFMAYCPNCKATKTISRQFFDAHWEYNKALNKQRRIECYD